MGALLGCRCLVLQMRETGDREEGEDREEGGGGRRHIGGGGTGESRGVLSGDVRRGGRRRQTGEGSFNQEGSAGCGRVRPHTGYLFRLCPLTQEGEPRKPTLPQLFTRCRGTIVRCAESGLRNLIGSDQMWIDSWCSNSIMG